MHDICVEVLRASSSDALRMTSFFVLSKGQTSRKQKSHAVKELALVSSLRSTEQIHEETVGAGDAFGEFAEKGEAGVDVDAFAERRVDEATVEVFFVGVVHGEKRRVFGVEVAPVVEATLLDPVLKIGGGDFVGRVEKRIVGLQKFHFGGFVGDARRGIADGGMIWRGQEFVPDEVALVLDDERAPIGDVIQ